MSTNNIENGTEQDIAYIHNSDTSPYIEKILPGTIIEISRPRCNADPDYVQDDIATCGVVEGSDNYFLK